MRNVRLIPAHQTRGCYYVKARKQNQKRQAAYNIGQKPAGNHHISNKTSFGRSTVTLGPFAGALLIADIHSHPLFHRHILPLESCDALVGTWPQTGLTLGRALHLLKCP